MSDPGKALDGKVALITGAASGIGRATALVFAAAGARIVVSDVEEEPATVVVAECEALGVEARYVDHDVSQEESWENAMSVTQEAFGGLDVLVNNAGVALGGPVVDTTLEDWRWVMGINLDGVFLGTKHGIRVMRERGAGSIINVSSATGIVGRPLTGAVSASKGGVRLLTKTAALECAARYPSVRINSVHPGGVESNIWEGQGWWPNKPRTDREAEARADIIKDTPMARLAQPEEIARAILFLASDDSSFMTGSELVVDGGFTAA
jgi:3(or 17)beta-hydroxysteroid dehydrogenase